jgi:NADH dehydrogenase [ubiquinone] 1 alpha subcomplex assembly factor 6
MCAGIRNTDADHAASHLGKAIGITTLLKGTPYHASKRRSYLPVELCAEYKLSQEALYRGEVSEPLRDVALAIAAAARAHLQHARELTGKLPKGASQLFLQSVAAEEYLKALEKGNFNVLNPALAQQLSPLQHLLKVKWHIWKGSF